MSKHTPGPWSYSTHSDGWCYTINIHQSLDAKYTPNWSDVAFRTCEGDLKDVQEANARLISAAPELLDACIDMLSEMQVWESEQGEHPAAVLARAAIAKATGE